MEQNVVFRAISSPTRRRILDILRSGERTAGYLAGEFPVLPQPAISRHLRVLLKAGLVGVSKRAQQRIYSLHANRLKELDAWISLYREFWVDRLDALERTLNDNTHGTGQGKRGFE